MAADVIRFDVMPKARSGSYMATTRFHRLTYFLGALCPAKGAQKGYLFRIGLSNYFYVDKPYIINIVKLIDSLNGKLSENEI